MPLFDAKLFNGEVFQKYVDVVYICLHGDDLPVVLLRKIDDGSFYKIINTMPQQRFAIFCHEDNVHLEVILATVSVFVAVLHNSCSSYRIITKSVL